MEITKHQIYQASSLPKSFNSLKPPTKYLASLLLFPVLLSCSSLLIPLLLKLVPLLSCYVHKNNMFLLFNGILVLLKVFRSFGSSYEENDIHEETMMRHEGMTKEKQLVEPSEIKQVILVEEKVDVEEKEIHCVEDMSLVRMEVDGEENKALITIDLEGEEGIQRENVGEDEEDEIGLLSTEELNKKFDDFIRKVKEGIKNEAYHANSSPVSQ